MSIKYTNNIAYLQQTCTVEEAEQLLAWFQSHPKGKINLKACEHLHTAILQVLLAVNPVITAEPQNKQLKTCLKLALQRS